MFKAHNFALILVSGLALTGCSFSHRPNNRLIPVQSFGSRATNWNTSATGDQWMEEYCGELQGMDGWAPPPQWFVDQHQLECDLNRIAKNYHYPPTALQPDIPRIEQHLKDAAGYFYLNEAKDESCLSNFVSLKSPPTHFMISAGATNLPRSGAPLPGKLNLVRLAADMLLRIDQEHETLLTGAGAAAKAFSERGIRWFSASPRMLSRAYPVGVALTPLNVPESKKSDERTNNQPIVALRNVIVTGAGASASEGAIPAIDETKSEKPSMDYDPYPTVTLSLSTVLNSADVLDRIEYVSTFIYTYPFPYPPNGDVSLSDEFWKIYFSRHLPRAGDANTTADDLKSSFDKMRVRFRNITTTVVTKDLNLGTIVRGIEDSLSGTVGGSIPAGPASVNPSVTAASKVTSSTTMQVLRQLDQRSTYVSPDGAFLRITQRGMSSVNLNGRFNEQVQLYIPPSVTPVYVVAPAEVKPRPGAVSGRDTTGKSDTQATTPFGLAVKTIREPLYSKVDAVVASIVVVRHPTKLRRSNQETYGMALEDAADVDFIVGLARPTTVQIWKPDRQVNHIFNSDLDGTATNGLEIFFDSPSIGMYEAKPLRLAGFNEAQAQALLGHVGNSIRANFDTKAVAELEGTKSPVSGIIVSADKVGDRLLIKLVDTSTGISIRLGQGDKQNPGLVGFSKLKEAFPTYPGQQ